MKVSKLKSLLLFLSFANFRVIPGEIVPYAVFGANKTLNKWYALFLFFVLTTSFLRAIILNLGSIDFFIDTISIIIVSYFVMRPLYIDINVDIFITYLFVFSIFIFLFFSIFPQLYVMTELLMNSAKLENLNSSSRGFPFFAPEPSYAGIFFAGLLYACFRNNASFRSKAFLIVLVTLTKSIWALAICVFVLALFSPVLFFSLVLVVAIGIDQNFLGFIGLDRLQNALELFGDGRFGLDKVVEVEQRFGSKRLALILNAFEWNSYSDGKYVKTYSLVSAYVSVLGTIIGFISISFLLLLSCKRVGEAIRTALFFLVFGPILVLTPYIKFKE